jgi:hypothetical protein
MLSITLAALLPQLSVPTIRPVAPVATTPVTIVARRCPLASWVGPCAYLDNAQKQQILSALELHPVAATAVCTAARDALVLWLGDGRQAWMFAKHANDNAELGNYVLGETAHDNGTKQPSGFGLRAAVFQAADALTLARVALHEGAHLAGENEAGATLEDNSCLASR